MTPAYCIPEGQDGLCGPAALAYVLRSDPDTAAKLLEAEGRIGRGTSPEMLFSALDKAGYDRKMVMPRWWHAQEKYNLTAPVQRFEFNGETFEPRDTKNREMTLAQWLGFRERKSDEEFVIGVRRHWLVIHGDMYFDNGHRQGVAVDKCPYRRARVLDAHRVTRRKVA